MMSVPELMVASSIPRLVHDRTHHLCSMRSVPKARCRCARTKELVPETEADVSVSLSARLVDGRKDEIGDDESSLRSGCETDDLPWAATTVLHDHRDRPDGRCGDRAVRPHGPERDREGRRRDRHRV